PLTRLTVLPRFVRRKPNIHHSLPAWYVAHVNVGAQVTHENDFIDSVSHGSHVPPRLPTDNRSDARLIDILPALKGGDSSSANHATHVERPVGSHFSDGWLSAP